MRRSFFVFTVLIFFLSAGLAAAQDTVVIYDKDPTANFENAGAMIGSAVVDRDGESLGMIEDVLFDDSGEASYLIVSHPETTGEEVIPIPFAVADPQRTVDGDYVIDVDRRTLVAAPTFARADVEDYADDNVWEDEVRGYFGSDRRVAEERDFLDADIDSTIESSKEKGQMTNPFGGDNRDPGNSGAGEPRWPNEPRGYYGDDGDVERSIERSTEKGRATRR